MSVDTVKIRYGNPLPIKARLKETLWRRMYRDFLI